MSLATLLDNRFTCLTDTTKVDRLCPSHNLFCWIIDGRIIHPRRMSKLSGNELPNKYKLKHITFASANKTRQTILIALHNA